MLLIHYSPGHMNTDVPKVCKSYGDKNVLRDFCYTFENGIYGLLGANGAGKSTLMNLINAFNSLFTRSYEYRCSSPIIKTFKLYIPAIPPYA